MALMEFFLFFLFRLLKFELFVTAAHIMKIAKNDYVSQICYEFNIKGTFAAINSNFMNFLFLQSRGLDPI